MKKKKLVKKFRMLYYKARVTTDEYFSVQML